MRKHAPHRCAYTCICTYTHADILTKYVYVNICIFIDLYNVKNYMNVCIHVYSYLYPYTHMAISCMHKFCIVVASRIMYPRISLMQRNQPK